MEEVNPIVIEKHKFQHRVMSILIALFDVFTLPGLRWREQNRFIFY